MNNRKGSSMATKVSKPSAAKKSAKTSTVVTVSESTNKERATALANTALKPSINAAAVMIEYTKPFGDQDMWSLATSLSNGIEDMWAGDMKRAEAMLYAQAHALQSIFMTLARRATKQEHLKQWEAYLRMGLKAQNQCRMTLETLATIKNPTVVIARQANINNGGQQQVNNGTHGEATSEPAPAANFATSQTELLEASDGERLDTRATSPASGIDPHVETVGAVHRPPHR